MNYVSSFFKTLFFSVQPRQSIINPDWDFGKMGIGGLDKEFNAIFRRAFASRVFPPEIVEQLGNLLHNTLCKSNQIDSLNNIR